MNIRHYLGALLLPLAFAACQSGPRTVENPLVDPHGGEPAGGDLQHHDP